jgi:hypothetical protein
VIHPLVADPQAPQAAPGVPGERVWRRLMICGRVPEWTRRV